LKILLMGNPNVGKSVIFSRLTGIGVVSANYPGTTVEYRAGKMKLGQEMATVIDAPGIYSLEPGSSVERVTQEIFDQGADVVVDVVDATNLERNLNLTLQMLERGLPTVVALNLWDAAVRKGIAIDVKVLAGELGVAVVPTVAVSGQGIHELVEEIARARQPPPFRFQTADQRWSRIGEIAERTQTVTHKHPSLLDKLEDLSLQPLTGIPMAFVVLYLEEHLSSEKDQLAL
jgi:ferrous iron transport protein B